MYNFVTCKVCYHVLVVTFPMPHDRGCEIKIIVWARQGFERSVKYPRFEAGLPASPVRGREGLAALVSLTRAGYKNTC